MTSLRRGLIHVAMHVCPLEPFVGRQGMAASLVVVNPKATEKGAEVNGLL